MSRHTTYNEVEVNYTALIAYTISGLTSYNEGRHCQIRSMNFSYTMKRLTSYNDEDIKSQHQSPIHNERTYHLQWGRRRQIRSVNHAYILSSLTSYDGGVVRSTASLVHNERTYILQWVTWSRIQHVNRPYTINRLTTYVQRARHRQIHSVNHSYIMSKLTSYNDEDVVRSTASMLCTQWADLPATVRKVSSDSQRQSFVHNEVTYILRWRRRCQIHNITEWTDLLATIRKTLSDSQRQLLIHSEETYFLQWRRYQVAASLAHNERTYFLQWRGGCQIHSVNPLYRMSRLTSYNEQDVRSTVSIAHTQWRDLHATVGKALSDPQSQPLIHNEQTY